jgi:predicted NBD/HSP70 family sugar kinase
MLTGTNLTYTKEYNLRIVHETIRLHGPISRAEIARWTGLTIQTVSNLSRELVAMGLITETAPRRQNRRGAPANDLVLNPDGAFSVGLDLDRDHLTGVLLDLTGDVRQRVHFDLDFPTPEEALVLLASATRDMLMAQRIPADRVRGVGVGIPGPMHRVRGKDGHRYLVNPKSFPGWDDVPLAEQLRERLGIPVFLENNATAAAIGERWYGGGQQFGTFFYFYFGSGLGGGLVINGQPYEGVSGNAGEVGYMPGGAPPDDDGGDAPHIGTHFMLQRLYERLRESGRDVRKPEHLEDLLAGREPVFLEWMDTAADSMARVVLSVENLMDPEAIFFGGRLPDRVIAELMDRTQRRIPHYRVRGKVSSSVYRMATAGADAAALGVATLPIHEYFAPAPRLLMKGEGVGRVTDIPTVQERAPTPS